MEAKEATPILWEVSLDCKGARYTNLKSVTFGAPGGRRGLPKKNSFKEKFGFFGAPFLKVRLFVKKPGFFGALYLKVWLFWSSVFKSLFFWELLARRVSRKLRKLNLYVTVQWNFSKATPIVSFEEHKEPDVTLMVWWGISAWVALPVDA